MTQIFGHRGASGYYPENTLISFEKALEMGVDGLELDVHFTQDGELVVFHDFELHRLTGEKGFIFQKTLAEIKTLKVHAKNRTASIPTLQEVLSLIQVFEKASGKKIMLNVEFKAGSVHYPGIEEKTYALCLTYLPNQQLIFSSFDHYALKTLKSAHPEAQIGVLSTAALIDPWKYVNTLHGDFYHPHFMTLNEKELSKLKAHDTKINTYTVNSTDTAKKLILAGVDGIITDYPDKLIALKSKL
ncbi:glycerophosphodiester phosphodiesterase [Fusibacter tunisiensis]|uniref:Glycerophosphoryl diester phosphodiesterase n=1 Tax=Fusibacter tunisiensis TaxID=1008308 RepID=A0ABS2MNT9_9FIRM|nr:glycerophosphodiester phosphodiesterase family protein [Fusibacter tunisiensis]MBM7561060.1 glycerophosphoryl diester phosphodiesterase [Fusibacter tunisiensis]